ncbi:MAG: T9SS type A sorting domain-containing protein, partial [Bacteroidales bacterium]|nr:T9SS type A sorting domain-containing protein [Bacteroidales bacterium]
DDNVENPRNIIVTQDTTFVGYFKKKNSIDEVDFDYSISVYPNPASEAIVINADEVLKVEILDMQGRSVMVRENTKEIDVSRIEDGVYTLRIVTPQGDAIRKIVKLSSK